MTIDLIKSIKDIETEGEQIEKESILEAKEKIEDAVNKGNNIVELANIQSEKETQKILSLAEEKIGKEIEGIEKQTLEECANIRQEAEKNINSAIEKIMERIVTIYGNS